MESPTRRRMRKMREAAAQTTRWPSDILTSFGQSLSPVRRKKPSKGYEMH